jgi:hypothetical protein
MADVQKGFGIGGSFLCCATECSKDARARASMCSFRKNGTSPKERGVEAHYGAIPLW